MTKLVRVLSLAVIALGLVAVTAAQAQVRIAGNLPLTGPVAAYSGNYFKGFEMGLEDACKKHNVDCSQFKVDPQDNAGKPTQSVSVIQKQLLDNPTVVISGTSAESLAIAPHVDKMNVPHFLVSFDSFISSRGKDRLRVLPNFKVEAPIYYRALDKFKPKKVYVLALNFASTNEQFSVSIEPEMKKRGISFKRENFDIGTKDYNNMVLKARQYNPDLYIVSGFSFNVYPILKAMRTYGIDPNNVMVTLDFIDLLYNDTPIDELKGFYYASSEFDIPGKNSMAPAFRDRFKAKYGKVPSYVEAYAYDTASIIVAAQAKHGKVTTETIYKVLPFEGMTGTVNLDKDGDIIGTVTLAQITNEGKVVEVK
jgi:branched-chain amino acid transport system substrate-binding protein